MTTETDRQLTSKTVTFDALPLGARFRYPGKDDVWVKLENGGCGIVAEWSDPQLNWPGQGVYSFADSEQQRAGGLVEWIDRASDETNPAARTLEDASRSSAFWKAETIAGNTVIRKLRAALVHSVSVIQTWHNMNVPPKQVSALWDLYWLNAPELKQIREALASQEAHELKASEPRLLHADEDVYTTCNLCGRRFNIRRVHVCDGKPVNGGKSP